MSSPINYDRKVFDGNWLRLNEEAKNCLGASYQVISVMSLEALFSDLMGNILTIVDAGYGEMEKTKYAKDLLKKAIWHSLATFRITHFSDAPFIENMTPYSANEQEPANEQNELVKKHLAETAGQPE